MQFFDDEVLESFGRRCENQKSKEFTHTNGSDIGFGHVFRGARNLVVCSNKVYSGKYYFAVEKVLYMRQKWLLIEPLKAYP